MTKIKDIEDLYREYTNLCSDLTNQISQFFLREGHGVTVSIINDYEIELLKKVHYEDDLKMVKSCTSFNRLLSKFCKNFGLEIVYSEEGSYKKMELDPEINTFRYEKIILRGVKNE